MLKNIKNHWKRAVSGLLAVVMMAGMFPASAFAADTPDGPDPYAPTGSFELNLAGATAWNGSGQPMAVYKTESGSAQVTNIPTAIPFALLEDKGGDRIKVGYVVDNGWTGSALDGTGWADKENILVNLPDVLPSIAYDRDASKQFNSRLTRHEYVIPGTYAQAEQLAQLQKEAMADGETLVVSQSGQTVTVSRAKGDPAHLHSYSLDGVTYQKYDGWTEYMDKGIFSYELLCSIDQAYSADPSVTLTRFYSNTSHRAPDRVSASDPTGGVGAYNPGSPGGKKPNTSNVAWSTDPERTFLRFTLLEFPEGVVRDIGTDDWNTWHVVGTPLNVVWSKGTSGEAWSVEKCQRDITWYNSSATRFNAEGANAAQLMASTVYSYDAVSNPNWVTTADAFQAATGISDQEKEQMFHCNSGSWSTGWRGGDYTSMWGTDAESVTPGNLYKVYKANDAFLYLLKRLSANENSDGWDADVAMENWSAYVHDADGNLRTKFRIIVETGGIFKDPDGGRRAYTLREMMAYSLYNNEGSGPYTLIYDQMSTMVNMARWMRQGKDNQFLEYPLDENGTPTGEELHSTNGFRECDSYVDTIQYARPIRDTIFSERRSFGLHIFSPFNFESEQPDRPYLEVTKKAGTEIPAGEEWGFTVKYTAGSPAGFTATKNGADCTRQVTETGNGLKFTLKADETIHIDFDADISFRCEVVEDDSSKLTNITGTGGTGDMTAKKFTTTSAIAKATFTNGTEPPPPPPPDEPAPGKAILYKRDANTNAGVGPATFKFSSVTNGDYEFDTDASGTLETIQWWDPTEAEGKYIKPGEYAVSEIVPPPNYMPTTEVQQIKLELDDEGNPIPAGPLVFKNLAKVGLRIVKYDRLSHKPMNGVTFEIFHNGTSIGRYETKGNGEIVLTGIEPGTYRAVEVDTGDEGHILDTSYQEVELIAGGGTKDLLFFNDNKPGMKLVKVDSSDPSKTIPGVKFRIRAIDGSYGPEEFVTNSSGEIDLSMLPEGSYEVTEVECAGYVVDDAQRIIHLKANDRAEFVFTNTKKPGFKLFKTSADGTPLDGVTFKITPIEDASHSIDRTTQNGGEIFVEDLEPGIYSVIETATLPDHVLDKTEYHVELSPGKIAELRISNDKRPYLTIAKVEQGTGKPIPGTKFRIEGINSDYQHDVTTGPDGTATLQVDPGSYWITEKDVPEPYCLPEDEADRVQTVSLNPNDKKTLTFKNSKKPLLTLSKTDADTGAVVPSTVFEVKGIDNDYQDDWTTGADGKVSKRVNPGTYRVTEKHVPAPYYLPDKDADRVQNISLNPGDEKTLFFKNHRTPELTIYKVDSVAGAPIEGAKFHVTYTSNGESADAPASMDFGFFITDKNGEIRLHEKGKKLYPGEYTVTEVEPAPGFQMKEPTTQKVILHGGESKTLTFQNEPLNAIIVQKYDSVTHEALPGCTFQLRFLGGTSGTGGTIIGQKTTGQNGTCIWTGLTAGTYIVEEIDPADGYSIINSSETVYISDDGKQSVVTVKFDNAPDGILLVRKVCSVNPSVTLANAEFKITYADGTLIGDSNGIYRTDEHGEIRIEGLKPGKSVIVTEIKAPDGFIIDTQSQAIQIKEGRTVTLTFKNQPKGKIIIQKRDSQTGQPLPGAEFRVTTAAGCEVGLDGVIGTATLTQNGLFTTDANGEIRISNLVPGAYVLTETKAPAGYVMDSPSTNVVIGPNGDTQTVIIKNTKKGGLIVEKYDSVTKQPLYGAQFRVATASGELVPDNEGLTSSNGLYTTNREGQIVLSKLLPGTYVVSEVNPPDNYRKDPAPQTAVVNAGDTQTLRFYDDPLCTLTILKRDAVTKKPLPKAEFIVQDSEGRPIGPDNGRFITGTDGTVTVSGLTPNATIVVTESKAPTGYVKDETPKNIVVRTGVANGLIFDNEPATTLIIQKFISGTENEPLSGVCFKVTDGAGAAVGPDDGVYYTDHAGEIVLSGLEPGTTVKAREIKTVEGFVLDGTPQDILIKAGEVQRLTFWNKRDCSLTILKQSTSKEPLTGAVFHVTDEDGAAIGTNNGRYTSDRNGLITITGLQPGQVLIVTEEKAPNGYVKDPTPKTIKIKQDVENSLIFENANAGSLIINKRSSVDKATPLEGVTFKITTTTGEFLPDEQGKISSNGLYYTDDHGQIILNSVVGSLVITEVKTIDGYYIHEANRTQTIEVKPDDTQTIYFYNDPLCSLTITKLDSVSGKPVPGTEFTVKDGNGNTLGRYTTGKDGTVTVTGLVPNSTIVVVESKVPEGYVLNQTPQTITVKNGTDNVLVSGNAGGGNGSSNNGNGLIFENDPTVTLTIHKYIEGTANEPLAGVAFKVTDGSGAAVGTGDGIFYTNEAGEIVIEGLEPGTTVTAREIKTVDGFVLDGAPKTVKIKAGQKAPELIFWNKQAGTLVIQKKDSVSGALIAGAQFQLTYANGGYVDTDNGHLSSNGLYTTDDKGEIRISGVTGTIVAKEVKSAPGYVIDQSTQTQTVTVNPMDTQTLVFLNDPLCSLTLTKLDSVSGKPVPNTEFTIKDGNGNVLGRYTTGKDGTVTVTGLIPGSTVVVSESRVPEGYVLNQTPQTITVKNGTGNSVVSGSSSGGATGGNAGNNGLVFENDPKTTLVIQKFVDGTDNEPMKGVEFLVTDSSGQVLGPNNGYYLTDKDGRITITNLEPGATITVRETKTLPGYLLDGTPQSIKIKVGEVQTMTFWNKKAGNLIINKVDGIDKHPLAGVRFKITYADGSNVDQDGGKTSTNGIYVTDSNGQIKISGIVGTVIITEVETIDGYYIKEEHRTKTVQVNPNDTQTVTVYNIPTQALVIQKFVTGSKDQPLTGVEFLVTDSNGAFVGPNNGIYKTDQFGRITIKDLTPGTVITARETKSLDEYVLDSTPQSIEIKSGEVQTLTFYNAPIGGLELIKVSEADKSQRIKGVTFEIRKMDGALVDTVTTGDNGRVHVSLDAGDYYCVEIEAAEGFKIDSTPHYFTIQDNKTTTLTVTNKPFSGILIHKVDSATKEGIYGATFLLCNANKNPIGQYSSDDRGYVYIDDLTAGGRYYLRELENEGYIVDTQLKTVYVTPGTTTEITWENTAITGQIQITKTSADYNSMNGWPAGTPIPGTEFEIYHYRTGNLVDTIRTDKNGVAVSKPLPLGRYKIMESKAADFYGLDKTPIEVEIEHAGQIVKAAMTNKALYTNVSIKKVGFVEVMPGQQIRYDFSDIANNSTTALTSFYWRDTLPTQAVRLDKIVTGTYNVQGNYKIVFKTNLNGEYRTMYDNLSTQQNYALDASPAALGLASNEVVTEFMVSFGVVPASFRQVEAPKVYCNVVSWLTGGTQFVNQADLGGVHNGQWIMATTCWVTKVYKPDKPLPRTGY